MATLLDLTFGPDARDRLDAATDPGPDGAYAALESFYAALNGRDPALLRRVWAGDPLVQLDNPVGGILRGADAVGELYDRILTGPVRLQVTFGEIVAYVGGDHAVFTGRETGEYAVGDEPGVPLAIRTTRYFRHVDGRWRQLHHHGSIDDAAALAAYQRALGYSAPSTRS